MMSKVLKHDFISTGRFMGVIYLIVAAVSGVTLISHYAKSGEEMNIGEALSVAVLLIISMCLFILTVVVVMNDFQKTLYGEQGYLTFTLPVKSWKILFSKVFVSAVWFVVALAALLGSLWITLIVMKEEVLGENYDLIVGMLSQVSSVNLAGVAVSFLIRLLLYFIQFAFFTITVFFTSTLANTRHFQKKSVLWTIVFFIPIAVIATGIANFFNEHLVFSLFLVNGEMSLVTDNYQYQTLLSAGNSPVDIASIFVYLILGVGIFFATHYVMSKKINIR